MTFAHPFLLKGVDRYDFRAGGFQKCFFARIRLGLCARGFGCRVTILRLLKVVRIDGHH